MVDERVADTSLPEGPTPVPERPDVTMNWGAHGSRGDRGSSNYGGPNIPKTVFDSDMRGPVSTEPGFPSREQVSSVGKTQLNLGPDVPQTVLPEDLQMPERTPGFFEGMLGGLVQAFTGVLGDPEEGVRGGVIRVAELAGEALDLPGEALGHIPINQMFGLENLEQAFDMLPPTVEKRRVEEAIRTAEIMRNDPTEANWLMSQYLRTHAGDYAAEKGLPQLLAHLIRPDATIQERFFMGLGVPSQAVARLRAGGGLGVFGNRAMDILNDPDLEDPALLELRSRYQRGEFGVVGSEEAQDRLVDEIVTAGYGWHDDPFIGMLGEMLTDPIIVAGLGTGLAAGALRTGALARRAANVARLAREGTFKGDSAVANAVRTVDLQLESLRAGGKNVGDGNAAFTKGLQKELGSDHQLFKQANEDLRAPERGLKGTKDYYAVKLEMPIEAAAKVSWAINSPFGLFGKDGVAGIISNKMGRNLSQGVFNAYGYDVVGRIYDGVPNGEALNRSLGHAIAYTQRSMMQGNLVRMLRQKLRTPDGKVRQNASLPDTLADPDSVFDRMLGYVTRKGKRVREATRDDLNLEAQQGEAFARRTAKQYEPNVSGIADDGARKASYDKQMNRFREDAAHKLSNAAGISIDQARTLMKNADQRTLSFVDYAHWGKTIQDFIEVRELAASRTRKGVRQAGIDTYAPGAGEAEYVLAGAELDVFDMANRATLVGENTMTMGRAVGILDSMKKAKDEAERLRLAQAAVARYEVLHQNFYDKDPHHERCRLSRTGRGRPEGWYRERALRPDHQA